MNVLPFGPLALLIRFAERADEAAFQCCRSLVAQLQAAQISGVREWVPAFTTLLISCEPGRLPDVAGEIAKLLNSASSAPVRAEPVRLIELATRYAGPDLLRVAQNGGVSPEEVVERHHAPRYRVHCLGFAPGFPYLGGLDPALHTPRLANPRPRVPAGSVAIGGEQTGVYSIASPGGWNLIGETNTPLFRPRAPTLDTLFLLRAGDYVRFVPGETGEPVRDADPAPVFPGEPQLRILSTGLGLTVQDGGRPGFARFGVPPGGMMDPGAAAWANRLLENPVESPVLELCLQGQRLEVLQEGWLALTGSAGGPLRGRSGWSAFRVHTGDVLEFPAGRAGVWSYLAIPGGFAAERLLGSASVNPRAGLGMAFTAGQELAGDGSSRFQPPSATSGRRVFWTEVTDYSAPVLLRVWPGPQGDFFTDADRARFFAEAWTVSSQCDRVGYRLKGPILRPEPAELISEPVLPGSIQVPANGQPIVTMPDGPTLGGYPKLGLVDPEDLPRLAQMRPGQRVRFEPR